MKRFTKMLKSNEGFTLVELMIVLSIIAILAVVLVPKVGQMKDSVRNQGVTVNINSMRAYLELNVSKRGTATPVEATRLIPLMVSEFGAVGNQIANPFSNGTSIGDWAVSNGVSTYSVCVYGGYGVAYPTNFATTNGNYTGLYPTRKGQIVVFVYTDAYALFGYDSTGRAIGLQVIR